ncbi:carbohydrate ABC transporter permease [Sphaerochaeta globosa]|uniref:ABC-type transporter, integral membrane subunit n=1 Tax=Sphaerochaeta globosa (strain ATCC BAA-1886 / DSM 22777 / Buddy) TaxID=158189 RepID=F0RRH3_SPHGB|nr:sugar ABC transporter permease [Sphaerochaeta globosa]ADY14225.1 ABC-type transporter, integral membrane subunit [Sphaerochaeta globosa str. Buddy]
MKKRRWNSGWLFLLPALIAFIMFKYYPILSGITISFFRYQIMKPPGVFIGFGNYIRAFRDPYVLNALKNNLEFWAIMLILNFWVPLVLAIMVNEVKKFKGLIRTLFYIPAILPSVVVTVLWKYIWQPDYGLANYILGQAGLPHQLWLNSTFLVKWCMRYPYLFIFAGLSAGMDFIIYLASLNNVPKELYESAQIDGAGFWSKLFSLTLPTIRPTISMLLITNTIAIFNLFDEPKIMTGGGPAKSTETLVLYAFDKAYTGGEYSYAITITTIAFVIVFLLTILQMRMQKRANR